MTDSPDLQPPVRGLLLEGRGMARIFFCGEDLPGGGQERVCSGESGELAFPLVAGDLDPSLQDQ